MLLSAVTQRYAATIKITLLPLTQQATMMRTWGIALLLACQLLLTFGFSPAPSNKDQLTPLALSKGVTIPDGHGNEIHVGSVVRVVAHDLKAYQVSPKGFGHYKEKFVPAPPNSDKKNLVVPWELQGEVTKIYNGEISANLPIQVKFEPGQHVDQYDPPVAFLMHFMPEEVECVVRTKEKLTYKDKRGYP